MDLVDLAVNQLKRAVAIKERIEALTKELHDVLGESTGSPAQKKRTMSAATKKKISAAQKARLANLRRARPPTQLAKRAVKAKKKTMSPAARAQLSAKLKSYWASKKSGKK